MSPIYPKGAPESRVLMFHELGRQAASHVFSSELSRRCFLFWSDYCHTTCPRKQPLGGPASSLATGPPMAAVFFGGGEVLRGRSVEDPQRAWSWSVFGLLGPQEEHRRKHPPKRRVIRSQEMTSCCSCCCRQRR